MTLVAKFRRCLSLENKYIHVENDGSYFTERNGNKLSIYFEWSNGKNDWIHNFLFGAKPYRDMKDSWRCHRGFLKVWKSIEPYICNEILDPEVTEIDIVGYSHGAAIAQLCHEYVRFHRPDILVTGVGYGAPRVFWGFAKKAVRERFKGFLVVRNGNDLITHLPPIIFGYWHICEVFTVGKYKELILDHYPERYESSLGDPLIICKCPTYECTSCKKCECDICMKEADSSEGTKVCLCDAKKQRDLGRNMQK